MRHFISGLLLCLIILTVTAGCGGSPEASAPKATVNILQINGWCSTDGTKYYNCFDTKAACDASLGAGMTCEEAIHE